MDTNWRATQVLIESFWHFSFQESHDFHMRLDSNEHFLREKWLEPDSAQLHFHYFLSNLGLKFKNTLNYYFKNLSTLFFFKSNLGVKQPSLSTDQTPLITVAEHYKFSNLFQKKFKGILFASTSTVNNKMFWSLLFNATLVRYELGQFFRQSLEELIVKVLNN